MQGNEKALEKVNVLNLKANDYCYYDRYKEPFQVVEAGRTTRGVAFVEIKSTKTNRSFIFTDTYFVNIDKREMISIA